MMPNSCTEAHKMTMASFAAAYAETTGGDKLPSGLPGPRPRKSRAKKEPEKLEWKNRLKCRKCGAEIITFGADTGLIFQICDPCSSRHDRLLKYGTPPSVGS